MDNCKSLKEFPVLKELKKEPGIGETICSSNFLDELHKNPDPQKYHYKEELDLQWVEKDNIYDEINENLNPQKYHYKEELDLNWDEKDNNYEENYEALNGNSIIKSNQNKVTQNEPIAVVKDIKPRSTKEKNVKFENPDAKKDCPRCKKRLKNRNTLMKHMFYCGKAPHIQCDSCSYKAKYKNALISHIIRNHPGQIQKSSKKKVTQKTESKSNKVLKEQQETDKCSRFCVNCNVSTDQSKLNKCKNCASRLLYQCRKCNETFQSREKLTRHIIDKCDPKGYYHCPACDFKATLKKDVKFHLPVHLMPGSRLDTEVIKWKKIEGKNDAAHSLFTCPNCDKQFQRNASLASHMRFCITSQGVSKPPASYVDKKKPAQKHNILRHCSKCNVKVEILRNKNQPSKCCGAKILYKCLKCNRCYENNGSINYHVRNACSLKTDYKCDMCDYEGTKDNLASHRLRRHGIKNRVVCPNCKSMVKNKNLKSHLCDRKKVFWECDYCLRKYKNKKRLAAHIMEKHLK